MISDILKFILENLNLGFENLLIELLADLTLLASRDLSIVGEIMIRPERAKFIPYSINIK